MDEREKKEQNATKQSLDDMILSMTDNSSASGKKKKNTELSGSSLSGKKRTSRPQKLVFGDDDGQTERPDRTLSFSKSHDEQAVIPSPETEEPVADAVIDDVIAASAEPEEPAADEVAAVLEELSAEAEENEAEKESIPAEEEAPTVPEEELSAGISLEDVVYPDESTLAAAESSGADGEDGGYPDEEEYDEEEGYEDGYDYSEMYRELEKSRRQKRRKKNKGKLAFGIIFTAMVICISVGIAFFVIQAARDITGIDRDDRQVIIDIPENSTAADIAAILYSEGVIGNEKLFVLFTKTKSAEGGFTSGSHVLNANMPYDEIVDALQQAEETEEREIVDITFPEGITLYEAAAKLEESGVCEADRFIYIFNSSSFGFDFEEKVVNSADKFCKMEGYFFPDTYSFYVDEEPEIVAKKIYRNFENKITPDLYGRMNDLGLTLDETMTLASMIQLEGNSSDDMKKISSVFHNRLKSKDFPRLQSDPTSKYVENVIKPNIEVPNENMYINYDTYKGEGLPPGPVCNPGLDAVKAALYPEETEYYYFCANVKTGKIYYAETLEEHEENLVKAGIVKGESKNSDNKKKKKKKASAETTDEG